LTVDVTCRRVQARDLMARTAWWSAETLGERFKVNYSVQLMLITSTMLAALINCCAQHVRPSDLLQLTMYLGLLGLRVWLQRSAVSLASQQQYAGAACLACDLIPSMAAWGLRNSWTLDIAAAAAASDTTVGRGLMAAASSDIHFRQFHLLTFLYLPVLWHFVGLRQSVVAVLLGLKFATLLDPDAPIPASDVTFAALLAGSAFLLARCYEHSQRVMDSTNAILYEKHTRSLSAARQADSRLNHVLKNKSAEVCFLLQESTQLLDGMVDLGDGLAAQLHEKSASMHAILDHMRHWTHKREVFLQLTNGTYQMQQVITNIRDLIQRVAPNEIDAEFDCPTRIITDANMLCLILEEALSNARKYRAKGSSLEMRLWVTSGEKGERLRLALTNINLEGMDVLTPEQCADAFAPGTKGSHRSEMSDGLGLDTVKAALKVTDGEASLRGFLGSDERPRTVFTVSLPAETSLEVDRKITERSEKAEQALKASTKRRPPVCVGVDDSHVLQGALSAVFRMMNAASESVTMGSTLQELDACVALVLGGADRPPADIVVLDQNLDWDGSPYMKGTSIAEQLRQAGFEGLVVIYSGASLSEMDLIRECVHADDHVEKGTNLLQLSSHLSELYQSKHKGKSLCDGTSISSLDDSSCRNRPLASIASISSRSTGSSSPAPPNTVPLINLASIAAMETSYWMPLFASLFDEQSSTGILAQLDNLEAEFRKGGTVKSLAHRLKGDCRIAGLESIANHCILLKTEPDTAALLQEIRVIYEQTKEAGEKVVAGAATAASQRSPILPRF